jgi:hypothetical protein
MRLTALVMTHLSHPLLALDTEGKSCVRWSTTIKGSLATHSRNRTVIISYHVDAFTVKNVRAFVELPYLFRQFIIGQAYKAPFSRGNVEFTWGVEGCCCQIAIEPPQLDLKNANSGCDIFMTCHRRLGRAQKGR